MPDANQPTLEPNVEPIEIQEEMERSFLDYAVSVHALQEVALEEQVTALTELHRVLRPGGRAVLADIVVDADLPPEVLTNPAAWAG